MKKTNAHSSLSICALIIIIKFKISKTDCVDYDTGGALKWGISYSYVEKWYESEKLLFLIKVS